MVANGWAGGQPRREKQREKWKTSLTSGPGRKEKRKNDDLSSKLKTRDFPRSKIPQIFTGEREHPKDHLTTRITQKYFSYGGDTDNDEGSSSSGELRALARPPAKAPPPPRRRSYGDVLPLGAAAAVPYPKPRRHRSGGGERAGGTPLLASSPPRYVSFEDVIGAAETSSFGNGGGGTISDPLVRAASRLYAREAAALRPPQNRRRQRSPGPLGTRRGSAMHGLVKKYVHPFFGFVAGIFCCAIPA
ncbi:hypothetical protein C2845_PM15G07830 [Panicum miliaceum]|uniref:Uncharacterized protein n=1 Tax=Panicum miliaceum TaxID=4540 RepID=A0A3L6Q3M6_PANMI|nr:hypothetical protein C2845_PM15G07830 [Panicum miliaceum]